MEARIDKNTFQMNPDLWSCTILYNGHTYFFGQADTAEIAEQNAVFQMERAVSFHQKEPDFVKQGKITVRNVPNRKPTMLNAWKRAQLKYPDALFD